MAANKKKKKEVFGLRANSKEQFDMDCRSEVRRVEKGYSLKYRL
jgi:hypothetical protein